MSKIHPSKWAFAAKHQRILEYKECLASAAQDPCAGRIVRAHIIPRSQLRQIAQGGHVYAVPTRLITVMQMQGASFEAREIGVGEFATLHCFCAKHDKTLFAPLEDAPLTFSREQLALLHYRALSAQYYQTRNQQEAAASELLIPNQDEAREDRFQWIFYYSGKASEEAQEALLSVERALRQKRYGAIRGLIIRFKTKPNVMSVGAFRPHYNVLGKRVQNLDRSCQYIAMHSLVIDRRAALVFTWLEGDGAAEAFARCFAAQPRAQFTSLAIQTAFEHIEHTCMTHDWWLALKGRHQRALLERVRRANSLSYRRSYRCLMYRESYDDWSAEEPKFV